MIQFSQIQDELKEALQERFLKVPIPNEDGFTLIEGFMKLNLYDIIDTTPAGMNIPIVGILGKNSGRVYTFALKAILPNLKI